MKCYPLLFVALALATGCTEMGPPRVVGLSKGNLAPPLEGSDIDDKKIRLSDYRGKVVIVDFWATWCKPCIQAIPHEKAMVKRFEGRPFAFVSICTCPARSELRQFLEKTPLPWPTIYDGQPGSLARDWEIEAFPTFFVIDGKGVIRYRDLYGSDLETAVEKLLKEIETKS